MIALDSDLCDGCQLCAKICPHRCFEMQAKRAVLVQEVRCIECGACQLNCSKGAITVTKGTGCLVAIIKEDILGLKQPDCCCGG